MNTTKISGAVVLVALCCALSSCSTTIRHKNTTSVEAAKKNGPPPHAPAHGYRHKHGDVVLVFDSALEVYAVTGHTNYYFHKKHYYRNTSKGWEMTTKFDGKWKSVSTKKLPKGLRSSKHAKSSKKKK